MESLFGGILQGSSEGDDHTNNCAIMWVPQKKMLNMQNNCMHWIHSSQEKFFWNVAKTNFPQPVS